MPRFLQALLAWARRRPGLAFCGVLGLAAVGYWQFAAPAPVVRQVSARPSPVPGLGAERALMERTLLDVQRSHEDLRLQLQEHQRAMTALQRAQETAERERLAQAQVQDKRLEDALARAHQAASTPPPPTPAVRTPRTAPPAAPVPVVVPQASPPVAKPPTIHILRREKASSFAGPPPAITRADTPQMPAGSYAAGRLVTGVMATSRAGGALPVLFAVTQPFAGPYQLGGPGVRPRATALPVDGCLMLGKAQADLGSQRVIVQLEFLSCVFPDGATFERSVKGYATGEDGTLGLYGQLETRDSAYLARTFLTSLMSGAAEAFALAKRTTVVTPFGGSQSTTTGNAGEMAGFSALAHASAQLSQFYLEQAERLMPVLWSPSGTNAHLVLQEGLSLEGLPTSL